MKSLTLILSLFYTPLAAAPIIVAVSVPPQATLVKNIGNDQVQVITLIPPGASPHTYNLRPRQLTEIGKAQLYFTVGAKFSFEQTWLDRIKKLNPNLKIIPCSKDTTSHTDHDHPDPHFWLSPQKCKIAANNITQALIQIDPTSADIYKKNKAVYHNKLDSLDTWIMQKLTPLHSRVFLVYHPAWTHFAHDYDLKQIAIEHEGKDPTPKQLAHLISQAKKHSIHTIFTEPQFNNASAQTIAREISGQIIQLDPLAPNIISNLKKVTQSIASQN